MTSKPNDGSTAAELEVLEQQRFGQGGFATLRRVTVRHRLDGGASSSPYAVDMVERDVGLDAVAVVPWDRDEQGRVRVMLRRGMRPALRLGRSASQDDHPGPLWLLEVVAGIVEADDRGEAGFVRRVVHELAEEAGLTVRPGDVARLGPPVYLSPGLFAEKIHIFAAQSSLDAPGAPTGDGTPMEQGSRAVLLRLERALRWCGDARIEDAKSEIALRRLREKLNKDV